MKDSDAPLEQYERLGLKADESYNEEDVFAMNEYVVPLEML
jgi:hypothetical protein